MELQERLRYDGGGEAVSKAENTERIATGLGLFSIGLGLAEIMAPAKVAEMIGVPDEDRTRSVLRLYGVREIAAGVGILLQPRPVGWLWGRVAGDLLDLSTLAAAMNHDDSDRPRIATATAAVLGVTALDLYCAQQLGAESDATERRHDVRVTQAVAVSRSPEEVYNFWRDLEKLPTFMSHLESVRVIGDKRSHWKAKGPVGRTIEWDAEITDDQPGKRIAWQSLEGADIRNSGSVSFERAPGDRGTYVRVDIKYAPPGGAVTAAVTKFIGSDPGEFVERDLRAFKQIMEVGEVVHSDATIHQDRWTHPAQPSDEIKSYGGRV